MLGMIRDEDMNEAETEFPGIRALYLGCSDKPRTFLELLARYLGIGPEVSGCVSPAPRQSATAP